MKEMLKTNLYAKVSPVYIVAQEEVSCWWWRTTDLKQFHEVVELTMDISTHWKTNTQV